MLLLLPRHSRRDRLLLPSFLAALIGFGGFLSHYCLAWAESGNSRAFAFRILFSCLATGAELRVELVDEVDRLLLFFRHFSDLPLSFFSLRSHGRHSFSWLSVSV